MILSWSKNELPENWGSTNHAQFEEKKEKSSHSSATGKLIRCKILQDWNWNLVPVSATMHLLLHSLCCCYSSCISCPLSWWYCPVYSFVHLGNLISFLCYPACLLEVKIKLISRRRQNLKSWHPQNNDLSAWQENLEVPHNQHKKRRKGWSQGESNIASKEN